MYLNEINKKHSPLIISNVWNSESAKIAEELGFDVIGTSSGAIASTLGYRDGENMSFKQLLFVTERISESTDLPLTVDLEAGYSRDPLEIVDHIKMLSDIGVVGINLEDSLVHYDRKIVDVNEFSKTLETICNELEKQNINLFINVRTDTFLLNVDDPVNQTISRAKKYKDAGAHGLFTPCIESIEDIEALLDQISLPLNVMCMPNLPDFSTLTNIGVKRISMGNFVFNKMSSLLKEELKSILIKQSFASIFSIE